MGTLKKYISKESDVVISVIDATSVVQESMSRVQSYPPATVHLGQAMMGAALIQSLSLEKGNVEKVGLQWKVDGPFGNIYAEARKNGHIRGTILNPQTPVDNYETSLGQGHLQVHKHLQNTSPAIGIIEAQGRVSQDLSEYLIQSEQRYATLSMSVKVDWNKEDNSGDSPFSVSYALGYLIDILPHESQEKTDQKLRQWDAYLSDLGPISNWELSSQDRLKEMINLLHPGGGAKELIYQRADFHCNCSQERADRAAQLSERLQSEDSSTSKEPLEVQCEYCGKVYQAKVFPIK